MTNKHRGQSHVTKVTQLIRLAYTLTEKKWSSEAQGEQKRPRKRTDIGGPQHHVPLQIEIF